MQKGDAIVTTRDLVPWYSGYGANASVVIPAGTVGTVQSVDVPPVRGAARTPNYWVARIRYAGETWQTSAPMGESL